jgi:HK97 gp10 family phage protein
MKYQIQLDKNDQRRFRRKLTMLQSIDQKGIPQDLRVAANSAVNIAKRKAPVDTGNLRLSIGYEPSIDGKDVEIFSEAGYSGYVEFGTRFQNAQPYFMPAVRLAVAQLVRLIDERLKRAINS